MELGSRIYKYRKQAGLSQEELGNRLNVTRQSVSLWETNQAQPSLDNLKCLAQIFHITLDELCGTENNEEDFTLTDNEELLCKASMRYTKEAHTQAYKMIYRKHGTNSLILSVISLLFSVGALLWSEEKSVVAFSFFALILFITLFITTQTNMKKAVASAIKTGPNAQAEYFFYADHFVLKTQTDCSTGTYRYKYDEVMNKSQDEKFIYLLFNGRYCVIDKESCKENSDQLYLLLGLEEKEKKNQVISVLLLALFVLTISSILLALLCVTVSGAASPLPDFPLTTLEHMWKFFLFLPISIASIVLGIVFTVKGYKCKKNIIGGSIVTVFLTIYGCFTLIFASDISHDMGYLDRLSEQIAFELPNDGAISIAYDYAEDYESFAMVKVNEEDADAFASELERSANWKQDTSFIPSNVLDVFSLSMTSDYDYFAVYNLSANSYSDFDGKLIFMAYNIDTRVLTIYCYK